MSESKQEYIDENFRISIEDGIIVVEWFKEYIDFEFVDLGIKKRIEMVEGKSYPMLSDIRKVKSGSREARQRLSDKDAGEGLYAVAVITKSKVHRILYNFFTSIYKDPAPTRLFTDKEEAIQWLEQFKEQ